MSRLMIKAVHLTNFRTLRDFQVNLGLRNVLVGPNMAGKSNLIDVFRFLSNMLTPGPGLSGVANAFNLRNGFWEVAWKGSDESTISISIDVEGVAHGSKELAIWSYKLTLIGDPRGWVRVLDEKLNLRTSENSYSLIDKSGGDRVLKNIDQRVLSSIVQPERSALEFEIPDWDGNAVREFVRSWRFYRLVPPLMRQANSTAATEFLSEFGDNLSSWLLNLQTRHGDAFARIKSVAKDVFPELEDLFTWPTQQQTVFVASREKHLKRPILAWQMSEGQLAFIALLSMILAPASIGAPLYCIEEPENNLHPRLLETLIELLKQVQQELGPRQSAQIIVSTHSPQLVDLCDLDELIVVERQQGITKCSRPSDKSHLRKLLERQEVGLGSLFYTGALSSAE
ncbi:MAG TPA: AAA family ATPase [Terriglobales bacterium]|nr:AAA family ATPase [Terriglobales bacterium]